MKYLAEGEVEDLSLRVCAAPFSFPYVPSPCNGVCMYHAFGHVFPAGWVQKQSNPLLCSFGASGPGPRDGRGALQVEAPHPRRHLLPHCVAVQAEERYGRRKCWDATHQAGRPQFSHCRAWRTDDGPAVGTNLLGNGTERSGRCGMSRKTKIEGRLPMGPRHNAGIGKKKGSKSSK